MRMHQCVSGNTYALGLLHHEASSCLIIIILWLQDFSAVLDDDSTVVVTHGLAVQVVAHLGRTIIYWNLIDAR